MGVCVCLLFEERSSFLCLVKNFNNERIEKEIYQIFSLYLLRLYDVITFLFYQCDESY